MIAGGYDLHLYCRHEKLPVVHTDDVPKGSHRLCEFPHEFYGRSESDCKNQARQSGSVFNRDGEVTCPRCAS